MNRMKSGNKIQYECVEVAWLLNQGGPQKMMIIWELSVKKSQASKNRGGVGVGILQKFKTHEIRTILACLRKKQEDDVVRVCKQQNKVRGVARDKLWGPVGPESVFGFFSK